MLFAKLNRDPIDGKSRGANLIALFRSSPAFDRANFRVKKATRGSCGAMEIFANWYSMLDWTRPGGGGRPAGVRGNFPAAAFRWN